MGETRTSAESMTNPLPQGTSHITSLKLWGFCQLHTPSCCGLSWAKGKRGQTLRVFGTGDHGSRVGTTYTVPMFLEQ